MASIGPDDPKPTLGNGTESTNVLDIVSSNDLKRVFLVGKSLQASIENSDKVGSDPELQADISRCIKCLEKCSKGIRFLSIFSSNEHASEINTCDLEYFQTEYFLGSLYMKISGEEHASRMKNLQVSSAYFEKFLEMCENAGIVSSEDKDSILYLNGKYDKVLDVRQVKINRFKRTREVAKQIESLQEKLKETKNIEDIYEDDEDETSREILLLTLSNYIRSSLDSISSIKSELELLEMRNQFEKQNKISGLENSERNIGSDAAKKKAPMQVTRIDENFKIKREIFQDGVFKPSWRQPTMSLEEYAQIEMANAMEREKREAEKTIEDEMNTIKSHNVREKGLEDDIDIVDRATMNDRRWDNWKDDNPKGSGVTKKY
mmetsp:Transcript_10533/g.12091  ORF Transcript_10533/g.12091 Transcript_10533/m.12091 type:complete len:376 (+) Transcript_10533:91-1218(+)|eukprot:CAMPEP_0184014656 /NCGR_PEP_ID=MMETSP0954-20121128/5816_1 /TAXON_ID=627963 /ORGANISM="Aplanochytrium sp, Strain PBS07" /LENGTH=375 /DNA_ID=CAMNT_0026295233 /DNA_START=81 /DNA_END=1208 /DNA_ORIENTATION=-